MGEGIGDQIKAEMERLEVQNKDLAPLVDRSGAAVGRWIKALNTDELSPRSWRALAAALKKKGIDPTRFKPVPGSEATEAPMRLVPLLEFFTDKEQQRALLKILEDPEGQSVIKAMLDYRLREK